MYLIPMEGPSLYLAAQQLAPFAGQVIKRVSGNTQIAKERFKGKKVREIFSWGKHLVFQFDDFALRVHFLMFGSFEASVNGKSVTGDYKRKKRVPRLAFEFGNGHIEMYSCSVRFVESSRAKKDYDFSINLMSRSWDPRKALKQMRQHSQKQVADVLLDQTIFAGLGNIIKNEILFLARVRPVTPISRLSPARLRDLVRWAKRYSQQFYAWRKVFELRKNLKIHRKWKCPLCHRDLIRAKTGALQRWSYYCPIDQK